MSVDHREATLSRPIGYAQTTNLPIADVATYLQEALGQCLTAVVVGVDDAREVGQWARGERILHPEVAARLRHAFQVTMLLMQPEDADTVRAWFRGMDPNLGDEPTALVLATAPTRVLQATRAFLAHG